MLADCPFCDGAGGWEDPIAQKSWICPICHPAQADVEASRKIWVSYWTRRYWVSMPARHYGPRFQVEPWLLVIHSGASGPGVAEYFTKCKRKVSTHLAWSSGLKQLVQCLPWDTVGWHVGGSRFQDQRRLNFCSIGIELPGPWDKKRPKTEIEDLKTSVEHILEIWPSLKYVVRHSDIDPHKRDPGPGFDMRCLAGLGLEMPFDS